MSTDDVGNSLLFGVLSLAIGCYVNLIARVLVYRIRSRAGREAHMSYPFSFPTVARWWAAFVRYLFNNPLLRSRPRTDWSGFVMKWSEEREPKVEPEQVVKKVTVHVRPCDEDAFDDLTASNIELTKRLQLYRDENKKLSEDNARLREALDKVPGQIVSTPSPVSVESLRQGFANM